MGLVEIVYNDINEYLSKVNSGLFFNERDFQMHLATYLKESGHYDDVDLEYYVPYTILEDYYWETELRLDIVVMKDGEYLPIELKYKTNTFNRSISRFGEQLEGVEILKKQGAQNLACYDFWKDVKRIELVRKRFNAVKHGLAVFVTNDKSYWNGSSKTKSSYYQFNLNEGIHGTSKHWINTVEIPKGRPDFDLDNEYSISWKESKYGDVLFNFFIISV